MSIIRVERNILLCINQIFEWRSLRNKAVLNIRQKVIYRETEKDGVIIDIFKCLACNGCKTDCPTIGVFVFVTAQPKYHLKK